MYKDFAESLQKFFEDYLVKERGLSRHTMRSYRDCFIRFIDFLSTTKRIKPKDISMSIMDRDLIVGFLNWLEDHNRCSVQTRNQRLSCMKSFFNFMMYLDPAHLAQWKSISTIKRKKCEEGTLDYLSIEALALILQEVDTTNAKGRRDLALLSLLYNSGVRVQELIDLTPASLSTSGPHVLKVFGKGRKHRVIPLDQPIMTLLKSYMHEQKLDQQGRECHPLFFNARHEKLSTPGVGDILDRYFQRAQRNNPGSLPDKISPHVFRHSRAMHLLQAGVNLIYIRDVLGHATIITTERYARVDSKAKREALESAYASIGIVEPQTKVWESNNQVLNMLKNYKF